MLWLERHVVNALIDDDDARRRAAITDYVDGSLRDMPQHLRFGVAAESVVLGIRPRVMSLLGRFGSEQARASVRRWEASPIGLVRQYPRLLGSLVLFADGELP